MLFYRAALPLSRRSLTSTARIVREHRRSIGSTWRALAPTRQSLLVLVPLRKGETFAELATGITPFKGRNKPEWKKQINSEHARWRGPGERANAELKKWHILRKLRCCPLRAGQIARAVLVLHERETR